MSNIKKAPLVDFDILYLAAIRLMFMNEKVSFTGFENLKSNLVLDKIREKSYIIKD